MELASNQAPKTEQIVRFGAGILANLAQELEELGRHRAMILKS